MGSTPREAAGQVQGAVGEAAGDVLETAKEQASGVASDVQHETRRLIGQTRDQLGQQATQQRDQAVHGLRSLGDELRGMADHGSGWGAQLARQGAGWTDRTAGFLDGRELADILEDVRSMARRRPGRFLLGAAVAGVVVGRMSRALAAGPPENGQSNGRTASTNTEVTGYGTPDVGTPSLGTPGVRPSDVGVPPGPRTGQDPLHHPLAAGEPDGPAAADPTIAGAAPPGQPTVEPRGPMQGATAPGAMNGPRPGER